MSTGETPKSGDEAQATGAGAGAPTEDTPTSPAASGDEGESWRRGPLPPPTLTTLLGTLYTQAMLSMGFIAHPATGKAEINLEEARHMIDTISMLEEKTHGNRTPEEINLFSRLLHEVRLAFVEASKQASKG
jgi:hypothetical protein